MLLRNIDQANGLCNGTRLQVIRMAPHVIQAKIISGSHFVSRVTSKAGLKVLICTKEGKASNTTTNVVYKEVLQNI